MEIVILGEAGFSGCREICRIEACRKELFKRYRADFFDCFSGEAEIPEKEQAAAFLKRTGVPEELVFSAEAGGVLAALWNGLHQAGCGGAFRQRDIPVRQASVEICEYYGLNPYRLSSAGTYVCLVPEGARLVRAAEAAGLCAAVVGYTEKGPAIRRTDGEEIAFLRRPEPDEIWKFRERSSRENV